jgi:hypothetical protein
MGNKRWYGKFTGSLVNNGETIIKRGKKIAGKD